MKMKNNSKIDAWLDKKICEEPLLDPYYSAYTKDAYYKDSDSDCNFKNSINPIDPIDFANRNIYQDHIYIDPNTNRYHANMLFRMMVDYSYDHNFDYILHDPETKKKYLEFNLMDRELKEPFYKFCFENT